MLSFIRDLFTSSEESMLADASIPLNREEENIQIELDSSIGNPPWLVDEFEEELLKYERLHAIDGLVAVCIDIQAAAEDIKRLGSELPDSLNQSALVALKHNHPRQYVDRISWAIDQLLELFDEWDAALHSLESLNDYKSGASYSFKLLEVGKNLSEIPETDRERLEHFYPGSYFEV